MPDQKIENLLNLAMNALPPGAGEIGKSECGVMIHHQAVGGDRGSTVARKADLVVSGSRWSRCLVVMQ